MGCRKITYHNENKPLENFRKNLKVAYTTSGVNTKKGLNSSTFGMLQAGRNFNSGDYEYGFNGKRMDSEVSGTGNSYDYGFRVYNPRIGKFLSVDPLAPDYPWYTPYQFAGNHPIEATDLDGLEERHHTYKFIKDSKGQSHLWNSTITTLISPSGPRFDFHFLEIGENSYLLNSRQTLYGRDKAGNFMGDFSGVYSVTKADLNILMGYGAFIMQDKYGDQLFNIELGILKESNAWWGTSTKSKTGKFLFGNGKELDFKTKAYELLGLKGTELLEINGTVYNANEAGNLIWSMVVTFNGSFVDPLWTANSGSTIEGRNDEANEQRAIKAGVDLVNKFTEADLDKILQWRLEYRTEAKENETPEDSNF